MRRDVRLSNGMVIRAGTQWHVNIHAIHHEAKSWQKPDEFIPERFDPSSPWYKRPDGGVRNPLAFTPFIGGHRGCLGKTFAEVTVRYTLPILYHHLDFEFTHDEAKVPLNFAVFDPPTYPMKMTIKRKVH